MTAAPIPWTDNQAHEFSVTGFTAADTVAVDAAHGKIYVNDRSKNRVLRFAYPLTGNRTVADAEAVFGQADMAGTAENRGGTVGANTLKVPYGLAVAANGDLWISDQGNHRVVKIPSAHSAANGAAAAVVLGQPNFTTSTSSNSQTGLQNPSGLALDVAGNLWVSDVSNQRVVRFANVAAKTNGAPADGVLGQADFSGSSPNRGGAAAANTLSAPYAVAVAGTTLWVAEYNNSRVLRFDNAAAKANGAAADGVLGQANFTSTTANRGGSIASNTLNSPGGVAADAEGTLYVSDSNNSRVLIYLNAPGKANGAAADHYLGAASFTTAGNLGTPWNLAYDDTYHRLEVGRSGSGAVNQYFNCYATTTAIASDLNPATAAGATVTFTATVTTVGGGPAATGSVNFKEGGTILGTSALNGSGQATFATSSLSDGDHSIVAEYVQGTSHQGSVSSPLMQVIGKFTPTIDLTASVSPSTQGDPVTFTATVAKPGGVVPTPTGSIEFRLDGVVQTTAALSGGGTASWTTSSLVAGAYAVTAVYSGDAEFRTVTSSALNQTVHPEGFHVVVATANAERDNDGTSDSFYKGSDWGNLVYVGGYGSAGSPYEMSPALKFDLSSVTGAISTAALKLRVGGISSPAALDVNLYGSLDDDWTDTTATATAPTSTVSPAIETFAAAELAGGDWVTIDVTDFVKLQFAGDKIASFVLTGTADLETEDYVAFHSWEAGEGFAPMLEMQMVTNAAPAIGALGGDSVSYTEGAGAVLLDAGAGATVTDSDNPSDFNGGNVTVAIVTNRVAGEDVLLIRNEGTAAGQIGVSDLNVTYGGVTIGTFSGGTGTNDLVITFNSASATPAAAQALVRNLTYWNSNATLPSTAARTVRVTVSDGDGGTSSNADVTVSVTGVPAAVSSVSSTTANGLYRPGHTIAVTVTFTEGVTVTGTPTLALNSGGTASYASGSGGSTLTFNYTVQSGESAADLDYSATNSLALSGGTIRDLAGSDATRTLPTVGGGDSLGGQKNIVVDGIAPRVASIVRQTPASSPTNADALRWRITFSEPVQNVSWEDFTVTGTTASVSGVTSAGGNAYDVTISGGNLASLEGTVTLGFSGSQNIQDAAGNPLTNTTPTGTNDNTYVVSNNTAPTATNLTQTATYAEDPGASVALADIVVADADAGDTITATLTLSAPAAGAMTVGTFGSATSVYTAGTGVWTVTGSVADVNAALAAVSFTPASNWDVDATIATRIRDAFGTGPADGTITLDVTPVNDAPTATNLTQTVGYVEDPGGAVALADIVVSDIDTGETITATLTLSTPAAGALTTGTYGAATSTYNAGAGVWTVTGSVANVNAALAAVAFTPALNWDLDATITTRIRDAANTGPADGTITLDVTAVNDAPVATITPASYSATEQTALTLKGTGLAISDVDADGATMTVTLSVTEGELMATAGTSGATVGNSGTASVTITGTLAQINAFFDSDGASTLSYVNSSNTPAASTTLTLHVSDGGATGTDTATINITAVNDPPTVAVNTGATTETGGVVTITTAMLNEGDPDDSGVGLTYTVTTAPVNGTLFGDTNGNWIVDGGEALAATSTFTQADIDQNRIKYLHGGGAGTTDSFVFSLADGGENGASPITGQTFSLTISERPVVNVGGGSAAYAEDGPAAVIAPALTITDSDSANLAGATITITDRIAGDSLSFTDQSGITGSFDAATGVLTLTGAATRAQYETALRSVTFSSSHNNPATGPGNGDRIIQFRVNDGGLASSPAFATVSVQNTNDAPSGLPTVSGTMVETQTLTANAGAITDADGLGAFSYRWQVSPDGSAGWTDVGGATVSTFTLTAAEAGRHVRVKVSYTDGSGTAETVYSAASGAVISARPRNAIDLTGANDHGWGTIGGVAATDKLTIELWVTFAELGRQQNLLRLHQSGDDAIRAVPFLTDTNEVGFYLVEAGGDATALVSTTRIDTTGAWHHLAFVFDAGTASIHVDGQPTSVAAAATVSFALANGAAANRLALGLDRDNAGTNLFDMNGRLDEVRVWNSARTLPEIRQWMSEVLTGTEPTLLAYYKADSTSGTTLTDSAGAADNLALTGTTDADWVASGAMAPFVTSVSAISEAGFTVEWRSVYKAAGTTADGYRLDAASDAGFGTLVAADVNAGTGTSHTVSGLSLTQGSTYYVRLRSEIDGWTSPSSGAVELTVPIIPSVQSVAVPASGTYRAGQNLDFMVSYDPAVTVSTASGTPRLQLTLGSTTRYATYQAASSTATSLAFRYTVQTGDSDGNGPAVVSLQLNGGTINSAANGQPASLALSNVGATGGIVIDAPVPPPEKSSQTITFASPGNSVVGGTVTLTASASSGLPVSFSLVSGPATLSGSTLTLTDVGTVTVRATQAGNASFNAATPVERSFTVGLPTPTVTTPTQVPAPEPGGTATLTVPTPVPSTTYQWQRNGADVANATSPTLTLPDVQPPAAGLYTYTVQAAGGASATSEPVIVGVSTEEKVTGTGDLVDADVQHPNGNVYDQTILQGQGATVTADPGKITRTSFNDLSDDIVQVEFSGAGSLSLVMDDASTPAPAVNYNQPDVHYVRGHVGIVITGADETTNLTVMSVGRVTAFDPTGAYDLTKPISETNDPALNGNPIFDGHPASDYDGVANVAFVAIQSANGRFGGIRTGNVEYFAANGFTGIYAPGVQFTGPINIGDIQAHDSAQPVLIVGSASDVRITGGSLFQPNGQPVKVKGIAQVRFTEGRTSQNAIVPAQANQAVLEQDGVDVTDLIVVGP